MSVVVPDLGSSSRWQSTLASAALTLIDGIPIYLVRTASHSQLFLPDYTVLSYFIFLLLTRTVSSVL